MAETTSPQIGSEGKIKLSCEDCGAKILRNRRQPYGIIRCEDCKQAALARQRRDDKRRKVLKEDPDAVFIDDRSIIAARKCVDCDSLAERRERTGRLMKRCNPCDLLEKKAQYERYWAKKRANRVAPPPPEPRINACLDCGRDVESKPVGRVRYRCETCRAKHRDALMAEWRAANPEIVRRMVRRNYQRRRAAKMSVDAEPYDPAQIYERDGWRCYLCKRVIRKTFKHPHPGSPSTDHLIPLADGGVDAPVNVVAAHLSCNIKKNRFGGGEQLLLIG